MNRARVLLLTSTKRQRVKWRQRMTRPRFAPSNLFSNFHQPDRVPIRSLKHTAEETVEKAKEKGSSWFGWGGSKAEETKKDTAEKVEQGADKVKREAQKRQ